MVGLWTPQQSVASSNWREAKTISIARHHPTYVRQPNNGFVFVRTDNSVAVSGIRKLASGAKGLDVVAGEIRQADRMQGVVTAAMHIPGVLNVVADFYSRLAVLVYGARTLHYECWRWLISQSTPKTVKWLALGGIRAPKSSIKKVKLKTETPVATVWVPSPAVFVATIKKCAVWARSGRPQLLVMPAISDAHKSGYVARLLERHAARMSWAPSAGQRMLVRDIVLEVPFTISAPLCVPAVFTGGWSCWFFN